MGQSLIAVQHAPCSAAAMRCNASACTEWSLARCMQPGHQGDTVLSTRWQTVSNKSPLADWPCRGLLAACIPRQCQQCSSDPSASSSNSVQHHVLHASSRSLRLGYPSSLLLPPAYATPTYLGSCTHRRAAGPLAMRLQLTHTQPPHAHNCLGRPAPSLLEGQPEHLLVALDEVRVQALQAPDAYMI